MLSLFLITATFSAVSAFVPSAGVSLRPAFTTTIRSSFASSTNLKMALTQDELKKMVGYKSVDDYVTSGMVVGLGTGSTAYFAVERLGHVASLSGSLALSFIPIFIFGIFMPETLGKRGESSLGMSESKGATTADTDLDYRRLA